MESASKRAQGTTRTWHALLGHLCPGSDMANSQVLPDTIHPSWMAQSPIGFCHGVPASAGRNAPLLAFATRLQMKRDDVKVPCTQIKTQCVWSEASRVSMESVHGSRHVRHRFHTEQVRPLSLLSRIHDLPAVHRRLNSIQPR